MEFLTENLIIVLILPLMLGGLTLTAKFFGLNLSKKLTILAGIIFSLIGFIFSFSMTLLADNSFNYQMFIPFININNFKINLGIYFGKTELILASLLYFISFVIQIYSVSYIDKKEHNRFFALTNLFVFSMSGLIFSLNLFQFYIFWELIGLFSYLLIAFEYKKYETGASAQKVFLINRIGDFCLLLGIIIASFYIYTNGSNLNLVQLPFEDMNLIASNLYGYSTPLCFTVLSLLFLTAALCKSAQYPFSSWLIHAMKAPTPISALIHSATLVTSGVILFLKLIPLFQWSSQILTITIWFVLISAIITSISAITQTNLKKLLAYSTSAHLGIMFLITALGYYQIAITYLVAHAVVKSILFCNSGISDKITNEHNIFNLPPLYKQNFVGCVCVLLAILSITGILGIGFQDKNLILDILKPFISYKSLFLVTSSLCGIYLSRMFFTVFIQDNSDTKPEKVPPLMNLSLIILAIGLISLSFLESYKFYDFTFLIPIFIFIICGFIYYKKRNLYKIPLLYNLSYNGFFADKLLYYVFVKPFNLFVYLFNLKEICINKFYELLVKIFYFVVNVLNFIEQYIMEQIIGQSVKTTKKLSVAFSKLQNGNFQSYINYSLVIISIAIVCLLIIYKIMYSGINGGLE